MGPTEKIAGFLVASGFEDMPPAAVQAAKRCLLDALGVALAGSLTLHGKIILGHVKESGGNPECAVIGGRMRTSPSFAALANGTLAHALDYDDTWLPLGHPTCSIFPVVLALGEKLKKTGREVLEAFILGMEVHGKVGFGYSTAPFHSTPVYGSLGAAAAAAKMLGLSVEETRMALGIAASGAGGIACNVGTMTKPLHAGNAARNGLTAALLARGGFRANAAVLENRRGFAEAFIREKVDLQLALSRLGDPWHIVSPGVGFKTYPCCYLNHRPLAALLKVLAERKISSGQVNHVEVAVPNEHFLNNPAPETGLAAKFSLQFNLAAALLDGKIAIETFDEQNVHSPRLKKAMKKVRLVVDPGIPADYARAFHPVKVVLKNGDTFTQRVDEPAGHWANPLTDQEILAKYRSNAGRVLSAKKADLAAELVGRLEEGANLQELAAIAMAGEAPKRGSAPTRGRLGEKRSRGRSSSPSRQNGPKKKIRRGADGKGF